MNKLCDKHAIVVVYPQGEKCPQCKPTVQKSKAKSVNGDSSFIRVKNEIVAPRDFKLCQRCLLKYNRFQPAKECHHILNQNKWSKFEYTHNPENLIMLCLDCHDLFRKLPLKDKLDIPFKTSLPEIQFINGGYRIEN